MISIIIPVYNTREDLLSHCVDSILKQSYKDFEIVIVNDGSNSETEQALKRIGEKDLRIKVHNKVNGGVSSARNYGLEVANGEFVCFADADDYLEEGYFESAIREIEKSDLVVGKVIWANGDTIARTNYEYKQEKGRVDYYSIKGCESKMVSRFMDWEESKEAFNQGFEPEVWGKLYKRNLLGNQKFDENLAIGEDVLFFIEYLMKCEKVAIVNQVFYYYLLNEDSAMRSMDFKRAEKYLNFINKTIEVYGYYSLTDILPQKIYFSIKELASFCSGKKITIKTYYDYAIESVSMIYADKRIKKYLKGLRYKKGMDRVGVLLLQHGINGYKYEFFKRKMKMKLIIAVKKILNR